MSIRLYLAAIVLALPLCAPATAAVPGTKQLVAEVLERAAARSGRAVSSSASKELERTLEAAMLKHGESAGAAAKDGGLELVEAASKHGDDVMRFAIEVSPGARRVLALKADSLLPLARTAGPEVLEIEAKAPGLGERVVKAFGREETKSIASRVPAEDLPRLLAYAEKADSPATRQLLLQRYLKEGSALFARLPAAEVLATGLSAAMVIGAGAEFMSVVMPYVVPVLLALSLLAAIGLLFQWIEWRRAQS